MKANIYDVAEKAGVSITTVSRVMNKTGRVSQKSIEKVNAVIKELGYHPNMFAKGLANKRTHIIGVLLPAFDNFMFPDTFTLEYLRGIQEVVRSFDFNILIINSQSNNDMDETAEYMKLIDGNKIDGLITFEGMMNEEYLKLCKKRKFPIVFIGDDSEETYENHIMLGERECYTEILMYLKKFNHKEICVVYYVEESMMNEKIKFFEGLFKELNLPFDEKVNCLIDTGLMVSFDESVALHIEKGHASAYVTECIEYAQTVLNGTLRLNKKIPEDVSTISIEHSFEESELLYPKIDSILMAGVEIGESAAQKLMRLLSEEVNIEPRIISTVKSFGSVKNLKQ